MATVRERHPALFLPSTDIDRHKCKRVVPMQVLNPSFPRTGTMSMQVALNILGYSCYHSSLFFSNICDYGMWNEALEAKLFGKGPMFTRADWDQPLGDHSAVSSDVSPVAFAEDLVEAYPDAKVILVELDVESWFKSWSSTVVGRVWSPVMQFIADIDPSWLGVMRDCHMRWVTG
ncbi:hypothetical protein MMC30_008492 [Trapelia coarctata]|nr:hypothetical protein [Trapelia coarctata]